MSFLRKLDRDSYCSFPILGCGYNANSFPHSAQLICGTLSGQELSRIQETDWTFVWIKGISGIVYKNKVCKNKESWKEICPHVLGHKATSRSRED